MKLNASHRHGECKIDLISDRIISAAFIGSFNGQSVQKYASEIKRLVNTFQSQPFAMIINNLEVEGGTPEAYQELENYNLWLNLQAIVAKAFIIDNNVTKQILLARTPALKQQNIAFFENPADATIWLKQQLTTSPN
ncbi:hypothetical protein [Pseudoalteromonas sp.]|uniref:hypothetical protein n=1 Tax=Pseudoalteromonas sp. TaxID=53249 RepID=UPI003564F3EA